MTFSDSVDRKFISSLDTSEWEILTEDGYKDITQIHKTVEYEKWIITLANGLSLECADTHILIDSEYNEVFAKDSLGSTLRTANGLSEVVSVENTGVMENMYDVSIDSPEHTYYTNSILSHNTTSFVGFLLHYIIFNNEKTVGILAHKKAGATEVLDRLKTAYEHLPKYLQHGIKTWNKGDIELENGSKVLTSASNGGGVRGKSISCVTGETEVVVEDDGLVYRMRIEDVERFKDVTEEFTVECSVRSVHTDEIFTSTVKTGWPHEYLGKLEDIETTLQKGMNSLEVVFRKVSSA